MRTLGAPHRVAVLLVVSALVCACGTRVPDSSTTEAPAGGSSQTSAGGLSVPSGSTTTKGGGISGIGGGTTGGGSTSGGVTTVGGSTSGGGTATGGGTTPRGSTTGGGTTAVAAPGVTATAIYVGARWLKNQDAANAAVGAAGAGGSDGRDAYRAVIDYVNKHGGIAGRRVVPIFASIDVASSTPVDQQRQANCARWTQDNKVFVIFAGGDAIDEECAKDAGALGLYSNVAQGGTLPETFRQYPHYVEIVGMNLLRMGFVTVDGLAKQGYFDRGAKIGMLTWDDPAYREALDKGFIAALKAHGLRLAVAPVYLTPPQTVQDLGATSAQVNNAVLKFESLGIDHVMMLDGAAGLCGVGCMGFEFMQRAKSQRYYPRYGLNDNNVPVAGQKAGFYPPDQLQRSVAVGWQDLDKSFDQGWHVNQTREWCFELMRKNGVALDSVNARGAAQEACDELTFLQRAVDRVGSGVLSPDNVIAAVNTLGSSFASSTIYGTSFTQAQHDGVGVVRNYRFFDSCTCFKYTSDPYRPG